MTSYSSNYEELVLMENSGMSCASLGNRSSYCRLGPMGGFEIKDYEIGEVGSMLILAAKDE